MMGDVFTLPLLEWITIPAGQATLEKGLDGKYYTGHYSRDVLGTFEVAEFAISKYPVTNAQFQAFIDDSSYQDDRWWEGLAKRFTEPGKPGWTDAHHPRETVSWYEAIAFCRWLSAKLDRAVTLPTEIQWQRAAQGDDGREYPWGSKFDKTRCNTIESWIQKTTPVDRYPQGQSPFGVFDMAGNVSEWCLNRYDDPGKIDVGGNPIFNGVLRSGSWDDEADCARSAFRTVDEPHSRDIYAGFRVVGGRR